MIISKKHLIGCALVIGSTLLLSTAANGQNLALKTNMLYWGSTTPNLGLEIRTGKFTTLSISGGYNPWMLGSFEENKKFQHWMVQPEFRLWKWTPFNGGFWGFHAFYGRYNTGAIDLPLGILPGLKEYRYEGWAVGAGVSYGHQWYLGPHWNLEATFGFGYAYMKYEKSLCPRCGTILANETKHYFGPTKLGVSFVYMFNYKTKNSRNDE